MSDQASMDEESRARSATGLRKLAAFVVFSMACIAVTFLTPLGQYFSVDRMGRLAEALGLWGPVIILAAGLLSPLLFIPRWPLAFVSGILYGVIGGAALANVASVLGAWLHFTMAKSFLGPASRQLLSKYGLADISFPRDRTFLALLLVRAFPLSSFVATNLLAGALKIPLRTYLSASFVGMIPSTLMYAAWGKLMKKPSSEFYVLAVIILVAIVAGTLIAQRYFVPWLKRESTKNGT